MFDLLFGEGKHHKTVRALVEAEFRADVGEDTACRLRLDPTNLEGPAVITAVQHEDVIVGDTLLQIELVGERRHRLIVARVCSGIEFFPVGETILIRVEIADVRGEEMRQGVFWRAFGLIAHQELVRHGITEQRLFDQQVKDLALAADEEDGLVERHGLAVDLRRGPDVAFADGADGVTDTFGVWRVQIVFRDGGWEYQPLLEAVGAHHQIASCAEGGQSGDDEDDFFVIAWAILHNRVVGWDE